MIATLLFQVALLTDFCASVPTYESEHWAAPDVCHEVWAVEAASAAHWSETCKHTLPFTLDVSEFRSCGTVVARAMTEICDVAANHVGDAPVTVLINGNEYVCNAPASEVR